MTTVASTLTSANTPLNSRNGTGRRVLDACQDKTLWTVYSTSTTGTHASAIKYSKDSGASWTAAATALPTGGYATLFIDLDDYAHLILSNESTNALTYYRGTPNSGRTDYTWSSGTAIGGSPSLVTMAITDLAAWRDPAGGWTCGIIGSVQDSSGNKYLGYSRINITSAGVISLTAPPDSLTNLGGGWGQLAFKSYVAADGFLQGWIDFNHTGDGKTVAGGLPHIWVGYHQFSSTSSSSTGYHVRKATYASGSWTWGTDNQLAGSSLKDSTFSAFWDGTRFVGAFQRYDYYLFVVDRNAADTTTTTTQLGAGSSSDLLAAGSAGYDANGNTYWVGSDSSGSGDGTRILKVRKWYRGNTVLDTAISLDTSANTSPYAFIKRGYGSGGIDFVYLDTPYPNFNVVFLRAISLNQAPGAPTVTSPNTAISVDTTATITWTAATDPEGDTLTYDIDLTTDNGASWNRIASSVSGTSRAYDFSATPATTQARVRIRAFDGLLAGNWDESDTNFTVAHVNPTPTAITPSTGATVTTDVPTLGITYSNGTGAVTYSQKGQWQLATDSGFTANVRTITEADSDLVATGTSSEVVPNASQLFQGTWYVRGRSVSTGGGAASAWTATSTITVSHPPTSTGHSPTGGTYRTWAPAGSVNFSWVFTDTSPVDSQTALQVIVERNSDGLLLVDTGKVSTTAALATLTISATYKDVDLRWKVRLWDSDDVVGSYSGYQIFRVGDGSTVVITAPTAGGTVTTPTPVITTTFTTGGGGRTQSQARVWIVDNVLGTTVWDTGLVTTTATSFSVPANTLVNGRAYTVNVTTVDSSSFSSTDAKSFTVSYVAPSSAGLTVDATLYDSAGYVRIAWTNSNQDASFYSWKLYRRVAGTSAWTLLKEYTNSQTSYTYRDYLAGSGIAYEYTVTQVKYAFETKVESTAFPYSVTPVAYGYWVIFKTDDYSGLNFPLEIVTSDSVTDEWERAQIQLIGRGRHTEIGTHWGMGGSLSAELRTNSYGTARAKWLQIRNMNNVGGTFYLRTPFGDVFQVSASDVQFNRMPGVGRDEFGQITLPYSEVAL